MSKIRFKLFNIVLSASLLFCITGCGSEKQESPVVESISQKEETIEVESKETETTIESDASEELEDIVKNDFFSVTLESMTEEDGNVTLTLVFTNVSDISYYKGDEVFQPGESWEKVIRFTRDKWENYDNVYIHYKLCDASIYDPDAKELFSGGAHFEMDEELNISNLDIFVNEPIQTE